MYYNFKDLNDKQKRDLLYESLREDGATESVARDHADNSSDVDYELRNNFGYEDITIIKGGK